MLRIKELDVLRGIAAFNVVIFHYTSKFRQNFGHHYSSAYDWDLGRFGVELFFMISGFVIFMSLQGNTSVRSFALKRFRRLYPEYWICLCITYVVIRLAADPGLQSVQLPVLLLNLTMLQGIFDVRSVDGVYWSLIPELIFYVTIGLLYYFGQFHRIRLFAIVWLSLMILNSLVALPFGAYFLNLKYGMFFTAGILFYRLKFCHGSWQDHTLIALSFVAALCAHSGWIELYVYLFIYLLFYLFVYDRLRTFNWQPLLFLGYISYPLYLIHQNIGFVLMRAMGAYISSELLIMLLTVIAMITLAWAIASLTKAAFKLIQTSRYNGNLYARAYVPKEKNNNQPDLGL